MNLPSEQDRKQYERWGVDPPTHEEHGEFDANMLIPFKATNWWLEGNILYGKGNHGTVACPIPTDYICKGIDDQGLPILVKIA